MESWNLSIVLQCRIPVAQWPSWKSLPLPLLKCQVGNHNVVGNTVAQPSHWVLSIEYWPWPLTLLTKLIVWWLRLGFESRRDRSMASTCRNSSGSHQWALTNSCSVRRLGLGNPCWGDAVLELENHMFSMFSISISFQAFVWSNRFQAFVKWNAINKFVAVWRRCSLSLGCFLKGPVKSREGQFKLVAVAWQEDVERERAHLCKRLCLPPSASFAKCLQGPEKLSAASLQSNLNLLCCESSVSHQSDCDCLILID